MPADATTLLGLVEDALETLYPSVPVKLLKKGTTAGKYPDGDKPPSLPLPCFAVSMGEEEQIDDAQSFEHLTVRYWVLIEYVKASFAAVASGDPNPVIAEDDEIRDVRAAVRRRFDRPNPLPGQPVMNVKLKARRPYEFTASDKRAIASGTAVGFDYYEARP